MTGPWIIRTTPRPFGAPWFQRIRPRRRRFRLDPHPLGSLVVWLHPDERRKAHPPVKPNRRRTHRRRK